MLHTKFRENRPAGSRRFLSGFYHIWARRHLGHVTYISGSNFRYPYPGMLHIKFQFDWPCGFREEDL